MIHNNSGITMNYNFWMNFRSELMSRSSDKLLLNLLSRINKSIPRLNQQFILIKVSTKSDILRIIRNYRNYDYFLYILDNELGNRVLANNSFSEYYDNNIQFNQFMREFTTDLSINIANSVYKIKYVIVYNMIYNYLYRTDITEYQLYHGNTKDELANSTKIEDKSGISKPKPITPDESKSKDYYHYTKLLERGR